MIAALFVQPRGVYSTLPDVDLWDEARDARSYAGPWSVVAHPPCAAWGRYSKPHAASRARGPHRGDDGGCFQSALAAVLKWGGVLEHPKDSHAFARFGLPVPGPRWQPVLWTLRTGIIPWVCEVDQGHYGHAARKPTWLLAVLPHDVSPPQLAWGPSNPPAIGSGARRGNLESLSKLKRAATPRPFAELLISIATLASQPA
jgi:hypothetical protein